MEYNKELVKQIRREVCLPCLHESEKGRKCEADELMGIEKYCLLNKKATEAIINIIKNNGEKNHDAVQK